MTVLWPRLPLPIATHEFERVRIHGASEPNVHHPAQTYTPVGAGRVTDNAIHAAIARLTDLASSFGYPAQVANDLRISFDRSTSPILRDLVDISWSEAGQRETWSFMALVALPHLTNWRFGTNNPERWIAADLTRHTWARLWWQAVVFEHDQSVLHALTESDLNQLLERRTMGGDRRLVCALARTVVERSPDGVFRRPLIRDVTARLLRKLAFIDVSALDEVTLVEFCRRETEESWRRVIN